MFWQRRRFIVRCSNKRPHGACVVWISEDLDDLLAYAHRIAVIYGGSIAGIVRREDASRQMIGRWMAGMDRGEAA